MPTLEELNQRVTELTAELATASAAREQAEKDLAETERWRKDWVRVATEYRGERDKALARVKFGDGWQKAWTLKLAAERAERDTALARVKSAEAETCAALDREITAIDALNKALPFVDRALAAETALASAEARVKELEASTADAVQRAQWDLNWRIEAEQATKAAETALASARTVISLFAPASAVARAWLASHPALVAAPSCGRAWCTPDNRCADCTPQCTVCGRWSGHCGCVVPAPVAAPCAGCAALVVAETALASARTLLDRIVKYAREDRATTRGVTRLARVLAEAETLLSAPAPVAAPCAGCAALGALRAAIGAAVVELERAKQLVGVRRALALLCAAQKAGG